MRSFAILSLLLLLAVKPSHSSVEVPSSLEEVSRDSISDVVVGEVVEAKRLPETANLEYRVKLREVLKGNLKRGHITATVHYQSRPGISIKTPRSGLESQMQVGGTYLFMFGPHEPEVTRINLVRSELLDQREAVVKRFVLGPPAK